MPTVGKPEAYAVVIGGANIDIAGQSADMLVPYDSNIGTVRMSHGGVGRNIAHNLALLGANVHLVAPFGGDRLGDELTNGCLSAGIHIEHSFRVEHYASSTYLYVMDEKGEMQLAINDMAIIDELTRERLEERLDFINNAAVCVIDANLREDVLEWACDHIKAPLFSDPISCAKAPRLKNVIGRLHSFKPNHLEAELLTDEKNMDLAAEALLSTGLTHAFISLGKDGLLCADTQSKFRLPRPKGRVVNATGAGDAMMAALVWAYLQGMGLEESGRAGLAASAINIESSSSVNSALTEEMLRTRMEEIT